MHHAEIAICSMQTQKVGETVLNLFLLFTALHLTF